MTLRGTLLRITCSLLLGLVAACGTTTRPADGDDDPLPADAGVGDDAAPDATPIPPDAMPQPEATPSRELVNGAGRLSGATYTFDVQLGHPAGQQPASGATHTLEGNAAIKP